MLLLSEFAELSGMTKMGADEGPFDAIRYLVELNRLVSVSTDPG
ncbi:MAG TPA: hypothetical protein VGH55_02180 [Chthoniobacterales bacterium]